LLQFGKEPVSTSTVFSVSRGTYLTQEVAIKKTQVPIDKVYYTWKLEIMKEEAQKWIAACERDPNEEYILQLIGITFHEESYM